MANRQPRPIGLLFLLLVLLGALSAVASALSRGGSLEWVADSLTYVHWSAERTPGYPAVISIIAALSPSLRLLSWVQYAALIPACAFFALELGRLLGSRWACVIVAVAVFGNLYMMQYPLQVRPETFYLALTLVHFGCVLRSCRLPQLLWPGLAGATLGLAILFRPSGYAFLFALPWLLIVWRERRMLRGAVLAIACALPILIACTGDYLFRGYFATQAFGGVNLVMQVATMMPPQVEGLDEKSVERGYVALEPLRRAEAKADAWPMRDLVETVICGDTMAAVQLAFDAVDADQARWKTDSRYWRETGMNAVAWQIAVTSVERAPIAYIGKVARQFYGLWSYHQVVDGSTARQLIALLDDSVGPDITPRMVSSIKIVPTWAWDAKILIFASMFGVTLLVLAAALVRRDPALRGLAYLAVATMCYFGVTAGVEVANARYSLMAWPMQCAIVIGVATLVVRRLRGKSPAQLRDGA